MSEKKKFEQDAKISWYRCEIDKDVLRSLTARSDLKAWRQVICQIGLFATTGVLACLVFEHISRANCYWSVPLLLVVLFAHGTQGPFMSLVAVHELGHKTPFRTKFWNEFFLRLYSFISWSDYVWFRPSHVKHHQLTVHADYDGEVVLPQKLEFNWRFWLGILAWNPMGTWGVLKNYCRHAAGRVAGEWNEHILPASDEKLRRRHRNWARLVLAGHLLLAAGFILSGHWFLIVVFTFGCYYCGWLSFLCGMPQHYGLSPNVPDFRLCCRTYTCSWLPAFFYWNMQYHVEHHMYPAVPFYNLPKLRQALLADLPPAPHGLRATWRELLQIHRKMTEDPTYVFVPELPGSQGTHVEDEVLEREAALAAS